MRLLNAWAELGTVTAFVVLAVPALLAFAAFAPGRWVAQWTAAALAYAVLHLGGLGLERELRWGWTAVWLFAAWRLGARRPQRPRDSATRRGGFESGTIGLLLAIALLALLTAAVARQDLTPDLARRASFGLLLMVLGMLHLMLRRDALRALLAFGALGLGLQILHGGARDLLLPDDPVYPQAILIATALALAMVDRLTRTRVLATGSPWVSDAHDLHD
jgi:hypothetical protein